MDELGAPVDVSVKPDFDEFVVSSGDRLFRTAYLLTRDHGLAEDLVQTALSKTWSAWGRIDPNPWPYVQKVIFTTYVSWWRRKRWHAEQPSDALPEHAEGSAVDGFAVRSDLSTAIGRLPRRQRAVIVLRYYEDLTERETAEVLGYTIGNVKSQASRAIAKLRLDPALLDHDLSDEGGTR